MAQSSTNTSSRRHARDHDAVSIASSRVADVTEWEANEVSSWYDCYFAFYFVSIVVNVNCRFLSSYVVDKKCLLLFQLFHFIHREQTIACNF